MEVSLHTPATAPCLSAELVIASAMKAAGSASPEHADEILICEYTQNGAACGRAMVREREPGVDLRPASVVGETAICLAVSQALAAQDAELKDFASGPEEPAVD